MAAFTKGFLNITAFPPFFYHVLGVVLPRPGKKMIRVDAWRIIAFVEDAKPGGNFSERKDIRYSVG